MNATSMSDPSATAGRDERTSAFAAGRGSVSKVGLALVSGLNLLTLALLAYHLAGHSDQPAAMQQSSGGTLMAVPPPAPKIIEAAQGNRGNIDLAPISISVLDIASGIESAERASSDRGNDEPMTGSRPSIASPKTPASGDRYEHHWVQLGALSKEGTARRYWSGLKRRHASLLEGREPRIFNPLEVGGGLHHIRVGPMTGEAAAALCRQLAADGADCFCIGDRASSAMERRGEGEDR